VGLSSPRFGGKTKSEIHDAWKDKMHKSTNDLSDRAHCRADDGRTAFRRHGRNRRRPSSPVAVCRYFANPVDGRIRAIGNSANWHFGSCRIRPTTVVSSEAGVRMSACRVTGSECTDHSRIEMTLDHKIVHNNNTLSNNMLFSRRLQTTTTVVVM